MRKETVVKYFSEDGKEFNTEEECLNYENGNMLISKLEDFLRDVDVEYNIYDHNIDEEGYSVKTIAEIIVGNFDAINKIMYSSERSGRIFEETCVNARNNHITTTEDIKKYFFFAGINKGIEK